MTDYCTSCLYEDYDGAEEPCINCVRDKDKKPTEYFPKRPTKPITNGDVIRSMDDEELGRFLANIRNEITCVISGIYGCEEDSCDKCWIKWLEEVSE